MLEQPRSRSEVHHARAAHTAFNNSSNRIAVLVLLGNVLTKLDLGLAQLSAVWALKRARGCDGSRLALSVPLRVSGRAVLQGLLDPTAPPTGTLNGSGKNSR